MSNEKSWIMAVALLAALSAAPASAQADDLFRWEDDGGEHLSALADAHATERLTAVINEDAFGPNGLPGAEELVLNLQPGLTVVANQLRTETRGRKGHSWFGRVSGDPLSDVIFTQVGDWLGASITYNGRSFWILPVTESLHEILELKLQSFSAEPGETEREPGEPGPGATAGRLDGVLNRLGLTAGPDEWQLFRRLTVGAARGELRPIPEDGSNIDVLVMYTRASRLITGDSLCPGCPLGDPTPWGILGFTQMAFDQANQSFVNSGIETRLNLVTTPIEVDYFETTSGNDLDVLRNFDGVLDEAHVYRDRYAADLVILMTASLVDSSGQNWCGLAYESRKAVNLLGKTRAEFEVERAQNAFALVRMGCAAGSTFTFTHEIGHLLGARHDRYVLPDPDPEYEDSARGYILREVYVNRAVRTMMAYGDRCDLPHHPPCIRVLRWSDPDDLSQFGLPLGIPEGFADAADSQHVIEGRSIVPVSNYRWWGCRHMGCSGVQSEF